ncbi:nitronate monooxygenase [Microbispora siamensis]
MRLDEAGEPVYGPRDEVDTGKVAALGLPFWLAGGYGTPDGLTRALEMGAAGIQVGSAFALCRESGLHDELRRRLLRGAAELTLGQDIGFLRAQPEGGWARVNQLWPGQRITRRGSVSPGGP